MISDFERRQLFHRASDNLTKHFFNQKDDIGADIMSVFGRIIRVVGTEYKAKEIITKFGIECLDDEDVSIWIPHFLNVAAYYNWEKEPYKGRLDHWVEAIKQLTGRVIRYSETGRDEGIENRPYYLANVA